MNTEYKIVYLKGKTSSSVKTMTEAAVFVSGIKTYRKFTDTLFVGKSVFFKDEFGKIIGRIWRDKGRKSCTLSVNVENFKG